jgi:ABC-type branched-subunit amino acid transport system ATPase component
VLALADRVTMIENGKSVETLTAKELGAAPDKIKRYLGV